MLKNDLRWVTALHGALTHLIFVQPDRCASSNALDRKQYAGEYDTYRFASLERSGVRFNRQNMIAFETHRFVLTVLIRPVMVGRYLLIFRRLNA